MKISCRWRPSAIEGLRPDLVEGYEGEGADLDAQDVSCRPEGRAADRRHHRLGGTHGDEDDQHPADHRPLAEPFDRLAQAAGAVFARRGGQQRQGDAGDENGNRDQRFHGPPASRRSTRSAARRDQRHQHDHQSEVDLSEREGDRDRQGRLETGPVGSGDRSAAHQAPAADDRRHRDDHRDRDGDLDREERGQPGAERDQQRDPGERHQLAQEFDEGEAAVAQSTVSGTSSEFATAIVRIPSPAGASRRPSARVAGDDREADQGDQGDRGHQQPLPEHVCDQGPPLPGLNLGPARCWRWR